MKYKVGDKVRLHDHVGDGPISYPILREIQEEDGCLIVRTVKPHSWHVPLITDPVYQFIGDGLRGDNCWVSIEKNSELVRFAIARPKPFKLTNNG